MRSRARSFAIQVGCALAIAMLALFSGSAGLSPRGPGSLILLADNASAPAPTAPASRLAANYGKLPLPFELNQGQTDGRVKFLSRGRGYELFLTGDEAVLTLGRASQNAKVKSQKASIEAGAGRPGRDGRPAPAGLNSSATAADPATADSVLHLRLVGANSHAIAVGGEELPGKVNYFLGNDPQKWHHNVPTYAQVKYHHIYPGIDLVYYGNQGGQLEYDFVVAPGADPAAIRFALGERPEAGSGRQRQAAARSKIQNLKTKIDLDGDLVIPTGGGELRWHKPVIYQTPSSVNHQSKIDKRQLLEGRYVLTASNQIGFELGSYDHTQPLVIDPVLSYSTYLGGSNGDFGYGIAVDSVGAAYVAGSTSSTDFPLMSPLQATASGSPVAFVTKLNATGTALVYSTYLGGRGQTYAYSVAVDSSGNAYVTGSTGSSDFPTLNPLQATLQGASDAFVAKLNAAGSALVYSTYLGGSSSDYGLGIAVDPSNNAYVTGNTLSTDFPTVNPFQATCPSCIHNTGYGSVFVTKLNAAGSALVYSTYLGGSMGEAGQGIAVDSSGMAYVTGYTISTDFPTANPFQAACAAVCADDAFVTKFNAAGSALVYSTYLGGASDDGGNGIAVDSSGNAYVTGATHSTNFPTLNPIQANNAGGYDAFVAKLNAAGSSLAYSTYLGGSGRDIGNSIALDSTGNAYVTGQTQSSDFPTADPSQSALNGSQNAFVARVNSAGSSLFYSTYLGGSSSDSGQGIAVDSSGNAYVTGFTHSLDFPTANALQPIYGGVVDALVAKISPARAFLSSTDLTFGQENVGATSTARQEIVTNIGLAGITISAVTLGGANAADFATSADTCTGTTLAPNGTCTVSVTFTPSAAVIRNASLTFTDTALDSPQTAILSGTGILAAAPTISPVSPPGLTFSATPVGTSSILPVTVTNAAAVALGIISVSIDLTPPFIQTNNCLPAIPAAGSCTINVNFQPGASGDFDTQLHIAYYASTGGQAVQVQGSGIMLAPGISPASLSFSSQLLGTTSASQPVTIANNNPVALPISLSLAGDWTQTSNCVPTIAPHSRCTVNVSFAPTAGGPRTGMLNVIADAAVGDISPQSVSLTGTGLAPTVSLSPTSLTFAGQPLSIPSASQSINLTNTGNSALTSLSITASGDFSQTNNCPASIAPSAGCTINVTFTPAATGSRTGTLTLTDNAPNSPQTAALSGMGMDFGMSSSTPSATVAPGQTATYALTVAPLGGLNQMVTLACGGAPSLSTCMVSPNSVTLNGSASAPVTITVTTTAGSMAPPMGRLLPPGITGWGRTLYLYALLMLAALVALARAGKSRPAYGLGLCLVMMLLWSACGGGMVVHTPGTPAGTYPMTVTGTVTSGALSSTLTHSVNFSLVVN